MGMMRAQSDQEQPHADLPRQRPSGDALDEDIQQSLDRTACVFGSKLETPHPWVIKRTRIERKQPVVEFYSGMARTDRNWSKEQPQWNRHIVHAVPFMDREEALVFVRVMDLRPRIEVIRRPDNNGR